MRAKNESRKEQIKRITRKTTLIAISTGVVITSFGAAYLGAKAGVASGFRNDSIDIKLFREDTTGSTREVPEVK